MKRRAGMTLVEVLVAIFVMGIGLIALLALFPIGVLRIAQAIHDDKCVSSVYNASANAQVNYLANDIDVVTDQFFPYDPGVNGAVPDLFVNPCPKNLTTGQPFLPPADPHGASYPIFCDPIGFYATGGSHWVGGPTGVGFLRRRPAEFVRRNEVNPNYQQKVNRNTLVNFSLWDDLEFDKDTVAGTPSIILPAIPPNPATVARNSRFSWAYVLRRPQTADRSIVDCSVVVFDARSLSMTGGVLAEYVYPYGASPTYYDPLKNTILIQYGGAYPPPPVRPGHWIMDITRYTRNPAGVTQHIQLEALPNPQNGSAHANFYRVVAATDLVVGAQTYARYEVQQQLRGFTNSAGAFMFPPVNDPTDLSATPRQVIMGSSIVIEGIAEVFEKGPMRMP